MSLIKCPECNKEISDTATACPNCGYSFVNKTMNTHPQNVIDVNSILNKYHGNRQAAVNEIWRITKLPKFQVEQAVLNAANGSSIQLQYEPNTVPIRKKESVLSVVAIALTFFVFTAPAGIIVALIDLGLNKKEYKHTGSIAAIILCACLFFILILRPSDSSAKTSSNNAVTDNVATNNRFNVGGVATAENLKITFLSAERYVSDNQFIQPKEGYEYWKFEFIFENISDKDQSISSMVNWECFADNVKVDQKWLDNDYGLNATLSLGRQAQGAVYFEVPQDAQKIELEYDINFWKNDKIVFVGK